MHISNDPLFITILGDYVRDDCVYVIDNCICAFHETPMDLLEVIKLIREYMVEQKKYENFLTLFDTFFSQNDVAEFGLKCYIIYLIDIIILANTPNAQTKLKNSVLNFFGMSSDEPKKESPHRSHSHPYIIETAPKCSNLTSIKNEAMRSLQRSRSQSAITSNSKDAIPPRSLSQSTIKNNLKDAISPRSLSQSTIKNNSREAILPRSLSQSAIKIPIEKSDTYNKSSKLTSSIPSDIKIDRANSLSPAKNIKVRSISHSVNKVKSDIVKARSTSFGVRPTECDLACRGSTSQSIIKTRPGNIKLRSTSQPDMGSNVAKTDYVESKNFRSHSVGPRELYSSDSDVIYQNAKPNKLHFSGISPSDSDIMYQHTTNGSHSSSPSASDSEYDMVDFQTGLKSIYDMIITNVPDTSDSIESYATNILNIRIVNLLQLDQICKCQYTLFIDEISAQKYGVETRMDLIREALSEASFENCDDIEEYINNIMQMIRNNLRKIKQPIKNKKLENIPIQFHSEILKKRNKNYPDDIYIDSDNNLVDYIIPDINLNIDSEFKYSESDSNDLSDSDSYSFDTDYTICFNYYIRNSHLNNYLYLFSDEPDPQIIYRVIFEDDKQ